MIGYQKYVFDTEKRCFIGKFEEMYQAEEVEGYDSWFEDDLRYLRKRIPYVILNQYNFNHILEIGCGKGTFTQFLKKKNIPIKRSVQSLCDVLGFDPLYIANEGKFVCFVKEKDAIKVKNAIGAKAKVIGKVTSKYKKEVYLKTKIGSSRILPMLETDQLPRIC